MEVKRKTRMYEPWGYQDQNDYQGSTTILDNELGTMFTNAVYVKDDNKIHFYNKEEEELVSIDVSEFVKSDSIIEKTEYKDGILKITFTNGDVITIDLTELLDENEFKDGLVVEDHVVKVQIDSTGQPYISVGEDGIKIIGVDEKIEEEKERAMSAETEINSGLTKLIDELGLTDSSTLIRTNEHEVAFGTYNVSNTSEDASGQTIFSIGNGTSDENRSNALEVRKDGSIYMWIEGDFMPVNDLLGMLAHEVYDG